MAKIEADIWILEMRQCSEVVVSRVGVLVWQEEELRLAGQERQVEVLVEDKSDPVQHEGNGLGDMKFVLYGCAWR